MFEGNEIVILVKWASEKYDAMASAIRFLRDYPIQDMLNDLKDEEDFDLLGKRINDTKHKKLSPLARTKKLKDSVIWAYDKDKRMHKAIIEKLLKNESEDKFSENEIMEMYYGMEFIGRERDFEGCEKIRRKIEDTKKYKRFYERFGNKNEI